MKFPTRKTRHSDSSPKPESRTFQTVDNSLWKRLEDMTSGCRCLLEHILQGCQHAGSPTSAINELADAGKADEHPAFQSIRRCVAAESNLVSQLRVHETRALDALKWLDDRAQVLELKHRKAIRQHVNNIRREGQKAVTQSLKRISIPVAALLLFASAGCHPKPIVVAPQREVFVGISTSAPRPARTEVDQQIRKLIKVLPPGSYVHLLDLTDHRVVGTLNVPRRWNAGSLRGLGTIDALRGFSEFLEKKNQDPNEGQIGLDLPAAFKTIASTRRLRDACPEVILFADPQYCSRPHWSFRGGRSPSDICIGHNATPFGSERAGLEESELIVVTPRMNWGTSANHEDRVERFWRLYSQRASVRMHEFRPDLPGAFADVIRQNYAAVPIESPSLDSFLGLYSEVSEEIKVIEGPVNPILVRPISAANPVWEDGQLHAEVPEIAEMALANNSPEELAIALNWWPANPRSADSSADLDVWVTHRTQSDPRESLYWMHMQTGYGRLVRDVVVSGSPQDNLDWNHWELVYLRIDQLPNLDVFLNAYHCQGPVNVRIVSRLGKGPLHDQLINFPCPAGNLGGHFDRKHDSPFWMPIVPDAISHLATL